MRLFDCGGASRAAAAGQEARPPAAARCRGGKCSASMSSMSVNGAEHAASSLTRKASANDGIGSTEEAAQQRTSVNLSSQETKE